MTSKIVVNNIEADAGVSTVTFNSNVVRGGSNLHSTGLALGAGSTVGAVTGVTTYYGDGSNLTGLVSLTNGADNRIITASSATALNGESTFTYDNGGLNIAGNSSRDGLKITNTGDHLGEICVTANRSSANSALMVIRGEWNNTEVASIYLSAGSDTSNKDDGQIKFYTSPDSGTGIQNRLNITSAGLVGIGQATPTHMLHVDSSNASDSTATAFFKGRIIRFDGQASAHSPRLNLSLDGTDKATILLHRTNDDLEIQTLTDSPIRFSPNSTERVRINTHGFVKMMGDMTSHMSADGNNYHEMQADNAHVQVLNMKHGSSNGYGVMAQFNHGKSTHWAYRVYNYASGSDNCFVRTDGDLENINNSYGSTSDVKLKENIVDAKSQWDDIKALKVRNFNYKADENKIKLLGLVAQEAETVCPSLVKEQPDLDVDNKDLGTTTKYLKYSILYMKAIKALQEAQTRIETLESKVAALEGS